MNRIILASHGGLSAGMKDTVQMILGELPNLYALATLRDETEPITVAARRLLDGFAAEDAVYIVTDVMGGSVNNEMLTLLPEYPAVHLICGMNASLVLTLASNDEALTQDELACLLYTLVSSARRSFAFISGSASLSNSKRAVMEMVGSPAAGTACGLVASGLA